MSTKFKISVSRLASILHPNFFIMLYTITTAIKRKISINYGT